MTIRDVDERTVGEVPGDLRGTGEGGARQRGLARLSVAAVPVPDLVRGLLDANAYPPDERPDSVSLIETHVSWLFLTGRFVYKVKKPVDLGFVDFTTLERRHFFCLEELRLNRRLSPDVYLDVVPIHTEGGRYALGGRGQVVDYAVKLRQLPADRWLSALLERGEATPSLMRRIAKRLATFHAGAARVDPHRGIGGLATVRANAEENFLQTEDQINVTVTSAAFTRVRAYTHAFLDARGSLIADRERDGRVRECHGDLHADQICVENGLAFIDCIEFTDRFRCCDVAADLAFPAMDIDYHGRPDLSRTLVRAYVAATRDPGVMDVLDFYKCYRAFTRGKVLGLRLHQPGLGAADRVRILDQASRYFALASVYAQLEGPMVVVVCGLMGTGKSTLATALGTELGAEVLSSDVLRKSLAGLLPDAPRPDAWGSGIYTDEFTERTYADIHRRAAAELRARHAVVLDASYSSPASRAAAHATAAAAGAPVLWLETVCPDALVRQRLASRRGGPSDGRLELLAHQRAHFQPLSEIPIRERIEVETSDPLAKVANRALDVVYRWRLTS